ncbi:hypothetical protein ACQP0C_32230 [Nocardia sp. CA-129566]|uniref:hypothetical protein n=1 Tax=Nocardia sp. CA-129566 TaxID=3239976 RepID=UPI003D974B6F
MVRRTFENAGRKMIAGMLPLAMAVALAGVASADPGTAPAQQAPAAVVRLVSESAPVLEPIAAGIPLKDVATNPDAENNDPLANGAAAGALAGAVGSGVLGAAACLPGLFMVVPCGITSAIVGALWGTVMGLLVGVFDPNAVPQVLP